MTLTPGDLFRENPIEPVELERFFSSFGFTRGTQAHRNLQDIVALGLDPDIFASVLERLLPVFGSAVDPDQALSGLERYIKALDDRSRFLDRMVDEAGLLNVLGGVLGSSTYLTGVLLRHPEYLGALTGNSVRTVKTRTDYVEEARSAAASSDFPRERINALHEFQRRELLRIGYRDLAGLGDLTEITHELSWLADAVIEATLDEARRDLEGKLKEGELSFSVIGVGKLGGEELNFSSDIDIFYIYADEGDLDDATQLAKRVNRYLTDRTSLGAFYRVDLRLRPYGSRGAIAASMQSLKAYYASWGETFERLVLSKARCVAGDPELGRAFLELVQPFVFRKYLDHAAIDEVRDIKLRIDQQASSAGEHGLNVKLGKGGIREIEFFVQALQILYGGERTEVRERATLRALGRLEEAGLVEPEVSLRLSDAYVFLRNVEHRLQIVEQRQTHTLPEGVEELTRLARRMRLPLETFRGALDRHRREVHEVFNALFATPGRDRGETGSAVHRFMNEAMDRGTAEAWLASLGFEDPRQAVAILESLRDASAFGHSPSRMRNLLVNVVTPLLETAPSLLRPGSVLTGFERLTSSMGAREVFFRSLLETPGSMSRIARVFALSDWLSDTLIQRPGTAEFLIDKDRLSRPMRPPFETKSRRMFEFYLGVQYLFDVLSRKRASRLMSRFAQQELTRWLPEDGPVALFALGKFGERELNYRSDLDVMAFYEGDYSKCCKLVERLVDGLDGEFSVDLRLRPEGRKGSLVWDLESTREYLRTRAEVWERMAWTKARFVGGNAALAANFLPLIEEFVYKPGLGAGEMDQMRHIRRRMERELSGESSGVLNLKVGRGGLVDLEFLAQFIQIREGIRIPNTAVVLERAHVSKTLVADYHFLRETESMLRLSTSLSSSRIEEKNVPALETMLGLSDFRETYAAVTSRVREAFDRYPE